MLLGIAMEGNMPAITDPMDALVDFRRAIAQREIPVQPADFHPDIFLHVDQPAGAPKYTYALVEGGEVTAVALLALTEPIEGVPTFQLGYAVMESRRRADARSVSRWQRSTRYAAGFAGTGFRICISRRWSIARTWRPFTLLRR